MEFSDLDRRFQETLERLEGKSAGSQGLYADTPMAADHYLLKRSWNFFQRRLHSVEEQWRQIAGAKDAQLKAMTEALEDLKHRMSEVKEENDAKQDCEIEIRRERFHDYVGFEKQIEKMRERADEERQVLQNTIEGLEGEIEKKDGEFQRSKAEFQKRIADLTKIIGELKSHLDAQATKERELNQKWSSALNDKSSEAEGFFVKIEVLRSEVERRDQIIKDLKTESADHEKEQKAALGQMRDFHEKWEDAKKQIGLLKAQIEILRREKDEIRGRWQAEQAEWRELWEREREMWERGRGKAV